MSIHLPEWFLGEEKDKPIYVSNHRKFPPNSGNFTDLDGGHAVVIVGWGVSKDLSQNLNKKYSGLAYTVNKARRKFRIFLDRKKFLEQNLG